MDGSFSLFHVRFLMPPARGSPYHHYHHHADDEINWVNVLFKIGLCFLAVVAIVLSIVALVIAVQSKDEDNDLAKAGKATKKQVDQLKAALDALAQGRPEEAAAVIAAAGGKSGTAATGGGGKPPAGPAGARSNIRALIDAFKSAKAAGKISVPTQDQWKKALKSAGSPLAPESYDGAAESDPVAGEVGHLVSDYMKQRAQSLGLMPADDANTRRVPVQPDRDYDFDGDGVPDFAIVHMDETMIVPPLPPQPLSLTNGMTFMWTLVNAPADYTLARLADGPLLSFAGHTELALGDDANVQVFLAHSFPFNGTLWNDLYVNSDGSTTFGSPESSSNIRNVARLFQSPPIITPLFQDLNNDCSPPGGGIFFQTTATESIFTWYQVPNFESVQPCGVATGYDNTFQVILYPSGNIEWRYGPLDSSNIANTVANSQAYTAVSRGIGANTPVSYIDFPSVTSQAITLGTGVQGWTSDTFAYRNIILNLGVRRFYETHPSIYDQVMTMYVGYGVNLDTLVDGSFANFNRRNFQRTLGLGERAVYQTSSVIPNAPTLESIITLRNIERLVRLSEAEIVNPTVKPIINSIWRTNTKRSFTTSDVFGSISGINFTGYPWQINFTGYTPVSSPAEPFFIDLAGKGAGSTGYSHESSGTPGGLRSGLIPSVTTVFTTAVHELTHRWNTFLGLRYGTDPLQWGDHFFDLLSRGAGGVGGAHPGTLTDVRIEYGPGENPWGDRDAKYLPKRPRGDLMCYSAGHLTQLVPKPGDPTKFVDARDATAVYPDTPSYDMNIADELCRAQGLDLFVSTPQAAVGGLSTRSLAYAGIVSMEDPVIADSTLFYVDSPRSPFGALGFDFDLREVSGINALAVQNLLFCGKRYEYSIANTTQIADVRLSPSAQAFLGPLTTPAAPQATLAQIYYGRRAPLIGDESDSIDMAVAAQYPSLYSKWNLGSCPLVSSATCNGSAFGRYGNTCVDVKTVAPIMLVKPGYEPTQSELAAFGRLINVLRTQLAKYMLKGHGARGMEGDMCYLPKWSFGIPQVIH